MNVFGHVSVAFFNAVEAAERAEDAEPWSPSMSWKYHVLRGGLHDFFNESRWVSIESRSAVCVQVSVFREFVVYLAGSVEGWSENYVMNLFDFALVWKRRVDFGRWHEVNGGRGVNGWFVERGVWIPDEFAIELFKPFWMREVSSANDVQAFNFGVPSYFLYAHSVACGSAVWAVNMQVGYYSQCFHLRGISWIFLFSIFSASFSKSTLRSTIVITIVTTIDMIMRSCSLMVETKTSW